MKKTMISNLALLMLVGGLAMAKPMEEGVINVNTAEQTTLEAIPGIGKTRAKAIVDYRQAHGPFKDIHDLVNVKGISEKSLQNILKRNDGHIVVKS